MQVPLEVSYRGVEKSDELEMLIREKMAKLERLNRRITSCAIAVESPQEHQRSGSGYRVRIDLRVPPGHELVATREPSNGQRRDSVHTVIRDCFEALRRQLEELSDKQRGDVKRHPAQEVQAFVYRIFPEEGYGFIMTSEGREVYFHRNAVLHGDFDRLEVGVGVSYHEEMGDKGLQASTVHLIEKKTPRMPVPREA
jgi:cold shock CspA family protein/ribosome-associated translation inhibitor RaiA